MRSISDKYKEASELLFQAVELINQSIEVLGEDNLMVNLEGYSARTAVRGFALDCLATATLGKNPEMIRRIVECHDR